MSTSSGTGVSIIGAGLSKFGRQPGRSGRELALDAVAAALADAGLEWPDVQVAYGGSDGSGLADTLVADLGLTGIPFTNVKNGCATGGSALLSAVHAIRSGADDRDAGAARRAHATGSIANLGTGSVATSVTSAPSSSAKPEPAGGSRTASTLTPSASST